ncbi:hypothetical protein AgCh_015757 [Apium graveolens]
MQALSVDVKRNVRFEVGVYADSSRKSSVLGLRLQSVSMRPDINCVPSLFTAWVKPRSIKPQAAGLLDTPSVPLDCTGLGTHFNAPLKVVNGALEYLSKDLKIAENDVLQGWVVSALLAGATVGSFTGRALADKFGRTKTFQLDAIPLAVGAFLCATAQSVQTMIIGRLLAGIGIGISYIIVPLYISEISPSEMRSTMGSINQLFICVGILAALVAGVPLTSNPLWWRTMFGIAAIPSVLLAVGMAVSPESPRWLYQMTEMLTHIPLTLQQGKISAAKVAVKTLYGKERVAEVMNDLDAYNQGSTKPEASWSNLFSSRYWKGTNSKNGSAVVNIGAALFLFKQLAGINAVVYYSASVFCSAGTTVASSTMDKQGRKSLLVISFAGMVASVLLLSISFSWDVLAPYSSTLSVVGTVLYVLSFSLGAGPGPALILEETFASRIRAKTVALSLGMHWVSNFVIGLYFLSVVNKFGISKAYLGFASVCVRCLAYSLVRLLVSAEYVAQIVVMI